MFDFSRSGIAATGPIATGEAARKLSQATAREVSRLAEHGDDLVRDAMPNATGETRAGLEIHQTRPNSLYARIRMQPKLKREPGSGKYPADRRPYIITAVAESGRTGGSYQHRIRVTSSGAKSRKTWMKGRRTRKAYRMFTTAAKALRREAESIRADLLTKGWS